MLPTASESLSENRIVRLLQALGLLVETGQIEADDLDHAHVRVILEGGSGRGWDVLRIRRIKGVMKSRRSIMMMIRKKCIHYSRIVCLLLLFLLLF